MGLGEDEVVNCGKRVAGLGLWRIGGGEQQMGRTEAAGMEDPSVLPSPHRDRVSPSRREPWRGWHIGVARRGCSQPPLSPAAAAAPDSASPASSLSQADPSCHPGTLRPPRLRGGGAPPPELGVPSQTDKMVERWGRSVDRSWPPQVLAPRPRPQVTCGSCRQPWAPGARAGRTGFPWAALMVLPQPPGRRGFGGVIDSWSPLGPKTWGWWLAGPGRGAAQACHLCPAPCGPFPGAAPFPPRGSLICLL